MSKGVMAATSVNITKRAHPYREEEYMEGRRSQVKFLSLSDSVNIQVEGEGRGYER